MSYNFPEEYIKCKGQYINIIKNEYIEDQEISEEVKTMLNDIVKENNK